MVERGRWKKLEYIDRICFQCNEIEDEYHVVMSCKRYDNLRKRYLPDSLYKKPSMYKIVNFINSNNLPNVKSLGLFIFNAFKIYENDVLYA